jgi:peptide/nickel transport system substrate-binding protein
LSYWERVTSSRLSRRRALAGAAGVGIGATALSLVGCGGGSKSESGGASSGGTDSGLVYRPVDTTSQAKPGGTFKSYLTADVTTFDLLATTSFSASALIGVYAYQRLFKYVPGKYPELSRGEAEGDAVESYEYSGDKLQLTLKIRPNLKLDPRAPTNGRPLDAEDVVFSWNKFVRVSPFHADLAYNADTSPGAPVESVSAPDKNTVVMKLKQPDPELVKLLAFERLFWVMPRESDGGFDPKGEIRGSGPWFLDQNTPSAFRSWTKNPDYYVKGRPFADKLEQPIVTEYATRLSQFKAGNIWNSVVTQEDAIPTKKDNPVLLLTQADSYPIYPSTLAFGYGAGDTPWKDERMRRAVSMVMDRELIIDVDSNRKSFADQGVDLKPRIHTVIGCGAEGYWADPTDKKNESWASVYSYNLAEAKKLMSAAGFPNGVDTLLHFNGESQYGQVYTNRAQLIAGMLADGGVRAKLDPRPYQNDWVPNYHYGYTKAYDPKRTTFKGFTGIIYRAVTGYPTVATQIYSNYDAAGTRFEGATPNGQNPQDGDPEVNALIDKIRREFDENKQRSLAQDLQKMMAQKSYHIPYGPYAALGVGVNWPVIGNLGVYTGAPAGSPAAETAIHWWIRTDQPPLKG